MPMIDADGCLINVSIEGRDGGPTLMLSNSLGCTLQMWEPQMKALGQVFRVIRLVAPAAVAGDLLRRASRQPRGQGGLCDAPGMGAAESIDRLRSRCDRSAQFRCFGN